MEQKEKIKLRYKEGASHYDQLLSVKGIIMKLACMAVWGFEDTAYVNALLELLPNDFKGKILDIPVGTGLFTASKYAKMKQAHIICVDYSPAMMEKAKKRFSDLGIKNVICVEGDVGNMKFADHSFDLVLSMNGFHAFPDKEAAWNEIDRVLKPGGTFIGCFYIKGENKRTDWLIKLLYVPKAYFTPPFETRKSLYKRLKERFSEVKLWHVGSIVCFSVLK